MEKVGSLFVFLMCIAFSLTSQITGKITNIDNQPIEFVNVALCSLPDSVLITGTVTDSLGRFSFNRNNRENLIVRISMVGYKTKTVQAQPFLSVVLDVDDVQLGEVMVSAQMIQSFGSKDNLIMPASIKERSASALSAIGQMPQFRLNALSNVLETVDNQKIIILINGTNTSEQELMSVQPQDIHNPKPVISYSKSNVLKYREETVWNNFQSLIAVSFVYSFSVGKKSTIRENLKVNNQDNESGLRNDQIAK